MEFLEIKSRILASAKLSSLQTPQLVATLGRPPPSPKGDGIPAEHSMPRILSLEITSLALERPARWRSTLGTCRKTISAGRSCAKWARVLLAFSEPSLRASIGFGLVTAIVMAFITAWTRDRPSTKLDSRLPRGSQVGELALPGDIPEIARSPPP